MRQSVYRGFQIALASTVVCLACACATSPPRVAVSPQNSTSVKAVHTPDCPLEYYPAEALRLKQEGIVVVRVCTGADSKVDGPVSVVTSSGNPALDEAAAACMAAGRFRAGTANGMPVASCKDFKITFRSTEAKP